MADAKIKKFKGNVTKLAMSANFIYIYDFSEIIVKYEFSQ